MSPTHGGPEGGPVESAPNRAGVHWSPNGVGPDSLRRMVYDRFLNMAKVLDAEGRAHEAALFQKFAEELAEELGLTQAPSRGR